MSLDVYLECDCCKSELYSANITHNLNTMADEAGIYKALWMPEELHITKADQLINILQEGLNLLESEPIKFQLLNPSNGWGTYEGLIRFVRNYLQACITYPQARVRVWR